MKGTAPEVRALIKLAEERGYEVSHTSHNSCHFRLTPLPGRTELEPLYLPRSPSDWRSVANARAEIRAGRARRAGRVIEQAPSCDDGATTREET